MRYALLMPIFLFWGCSSVQKVALRGASPLFVDGAEKLTLESNWDFFKDSAAGNLKLLESLYLQDTNNLGLLSTLIKGYAGYSYAVPETLAFGDELDGIEDSIHKKNAISLYTRSFDYGLDYFQKKGLKRKELLHFEENDLLKTLDSKFSRQDYTAVLFTAQSWASLINLQKDNVALVSHVPKVKILFDWVCQKVPDIEYGVCDIFQAQYEASRPRMLGGNPEKAKSLYQAAIQKYPKHLLIRMGFIQYSILPSFDKVSYERESTLLTEEFTKWGNLNRDTLEDTSEYKMVEHLNLYNAIARKRFEMIEKCKNKIFEG
jgi:hypothetical protein